MTLTPEIFTAICTGVTLFIYFTVSLVGAIIALFRKIDQSREAILKDVNEKHEKNNQRYEALNVLVQRHDLILQPEFNGHFGAKHHG